MGPLIQACALRAPPSRARSTHNPLLVFLRLLPLGFVFGTLVEVVGELKSGRGRSFCARTVVLQLLGLCHIDCMSFELGVVVSD